ncbi:MAG: MFS transporter [Muribaculaceae bacterium]
MANKSTVIPPILLGFFVMGFVDVVGISANYAKVDFNLSDTMANLLPMAVFLWFFVISIPTGLLMARWGKRKVVATSMLVTAIAMVLPFVAYTFPLMMASFALLGISNTMLQVSLNPLAAGIVAKEKQASILTMGQFIKAISSFLGPILATWAAAATGHWMMIFGLYAAITVINLAWLWLSTSPDAADVTPATFKSTLSLFTDSYIFRLFLGILAIVGIDVGLNTMIPRLLIEKTGMPLANAAFGTSLYFFARTAGAFVGAIALSVFKPKSILRITMIVAVVAITALTFCNQEWLLWTLIAVVGAMYANVFSIIFAYALQHRPQSESSISALMTMGVAGGALFPPIMAIVADATHSQSLSMLVLAAATLYLLFGISTGKAKQKA